MNDNELKVHISGTLTIELGGGVKVTAPIWSGCLATNMSGAHETMKAALDGLIHEAAKDAMRKVRKYATEVSTS